MPGTRAPLLAEGAKLPLQLALPQTDRGNAPSSQFVDHLAARQAGDHGCTAEADLLAIEQSGRLFQQDALRVGAGVQRQGQQ